MRIVDRYVEFHRGMYDMWKKTGWRRRRTLGEFTVYMVCAGMFLYFIFLMLTATGPYVRVFGSWAMFFGALFGSQCALPRHWIDYYVSYGTDPEPSSVEPPITWYDKKKEDI